MELFHVFFLFLVAKLRRISFCFVCRFDLLSFWIPSIFLTPPPALCKYSSASSSSSLPCRRFIFLSLTHAHSRSLLFSRLRALSVTAKSKQRKAHVVSRQSPSTSTSSSSPQNEQNFFVFLWGVSNNFWLIELLIKLIEMQREAATATATTLVNKNNVDWIKYFKAYCTGSESERERERAQRGISREYVRIRQSKTHTHTHANTRACVACGVWGNI